ncbi:MAG: TlpA family protein disulfide reductase [Bacteroidaceae bacterium]|nr:TlpA family protein disulfide reductase [Bacteroidaceae bacterium]
MKRQIIIILLAFVWVAAQAQIKCHIEGELKDQTQGTTIIVCPVSVDLRSSNNYIKTKADEKGNFACDVETDKMCLYNVFLEEQHDKGAWMTGEFLVENKATVELLFDENSWKVISGGREQMQKVKMDAKAEKLYLGKMKEISKKRDTELRPRAEELIAQGKNPEEDSLLMKQSEKYDNEYEQLYFAYRTWENEYYKTNPMLYALYDFAHQMSYTSKRFDEQKTKLMDIYHATYENFHPKDPVHSVIRTHEAAWKLKPGKPYIDYQVRNTDGKLVSVSSLMRDKVVLVDLWASWCGPCRRHSKAMIPIYEKYKDKGFTILAIAAERRVEDMQEAMKQDGYPWASLLELNQENHIWEKNGAGQGGGAMFLVDRDGIILSTSTEAEELEPLIKKALNIE